MKKTILHILLSIIFLPIYLYSQNVPLSLNRVMSVNDPNRNKNWDWTKDSVYAIYANTQSGIVFWNVKLPYYNAGGPASTLGATSNPDIKKEDGWVLVYRDFGTASQGASFMPTFILYNKYRGLFRLFYWNTLVNTYSHALVKLSLVGIPNTNLFSYVASDKAFSNECDNNFVISSIGKIAPTAWCYVDFNIVGYDNTINQAVGSFKFEIMGVNTSILKLDGNINLSGLIGNGQTDNMQIGGTGNNLTGFIDKATTPFAKGYNNFMTYDKAIEKLRDEAINAQIQGKWYAGPLVQIAGLVTLTPLKFFPILPGLAGFIDGFAGLMSGSAQIPPAPTPISLRGELELTGTMTTNQLVGELTIFVPGSIHDTLDSKAPLYNQPLGIFTLKTRPSIYYQQNDYTSSGCYYSNAQFDPLLECYGEYNYTFCLKNAIEYEFNPYSNLKIISSQVAYVGNQGPMTSYYNTGVINNGGININLTFDGPRGGPAPTNTLMLPPSVSFLLKCVPISKPTDTLIFMKTYNLQQIASSLALNKPLISDGNLTLTTRPNTPSTSSVIAGTATLAGQAGVNYTVNNAQTDNVIAGDKIILKDGFKASAGSSFRAQVPTYTQVSSIVNGNTQNAIQQPNTPAIFADQLTSLLSYYYGYNILGDGGGQTSGGEISKNSINTTQQTPAIPKEYFLAQNYPNPFNPTTTFNYGLKEESFVTLKIYNILGQEVSTLVNEQQSAGYKSLQWNANNVPSGMYLYRLQSGTFVETKKMMLLK